MYRPTERGAIGSSYGVAPPVRSESEKRQRTMARGSSLHTSFRCTATSVPARGSVCEYALEGRDGVVSVLVGCRC